MRKMVEFAKECILVDLNKNKATVMITVDDILMLFLASRVAYFINGEYGVRVYINLAGKELGEDGDFYEYVVQSVDCYHILEDSEDSKFRYHYHRAWFLALLEIVDEKTDLDVKLVNNVGEALYLANQWLPEIRSMKKYHFYSLLNIVTNRSKIEELMEYSTSYL